MNKRTVVYGLGQIYENNRERIEKLYNVVGYCDKNSDKLPGEKAMTREFLSTHPEAYDILLITAAPLLLIPELTDSLKIPLDKIHVLMYDDVSRLRNHEMSFYGLFQEDAAIMLAISIIGLKFCDVRYLEIGTNDPVYDNNSFNLYRLGARGVLVDPIPEVRQLVKWMRPQDEFLQTAVSSHSVIGGLTFYVSDAEQLSSLHHDHHKKFSEEKAHNIREIKVDVTGINDLLDKINFLPDVLLVDAEGEDEVILRGINYEKFHIPIIMAEVCHIDSNDLDEFMVSNGYCVFMTTPGGNTVFVLRSLITQTII